MDTTSDVCDTDDKELRLRKVEMNHQRNVRIRKSIWKRMSKTVVSCCIVKNKHVLSSTSFSVSRFFISVLEYWIKINNSINICAYYHV